MAYQEILYSKDRHIATMRFNAPERLNALSPRMTGEIFEAVREARDDDDVRVLVVTGVGEAFCAGGNAKTAIQRHVEPDKRSKLKKLFELLDLSITDAMLQIDKPTIASLNGVAAGAGCDLALTCDMRIASESARIGTIYIKRGLVPGASPYFLPRLVGLGKACELIFTGDPIDAAEAGRIGLVDQVVPPDKLEEVTFELADKIAKGPPVAMRFAKRAIYRGLSVPSDDAKEYTTLVRTLAMHLTDETREGFQSFTEKREPNF